LACSRPEPGARRGCHQWRRRAAWPRHGRDRKGGDLFIGDKCACQRPKRPMVTSRSKRRPRQECTAGGTSDRPAVRPVPVRPRGVGRGELLGGLGTCVASGNGPRAVQPALEPGPTARTPRRHARTGARRRHSRRGATSRSA
jgi:hypothetical protein